MQGMPKPQTERYGICAGTLPEHSGETSRDPNTVTDDGSGREGADIRPVCCCQFI